MVSIIRSAMAIPLFPHEVHLWYLITDQISSDQLHSAYPDLLSSEERERHDRFVFAKDRHLFLASRVLLRTTLSRYAAVDPAAWEFLQEERGRPEIAHPAAARRLRFSLSHTHGLAAVLVALDLEVGLDVEDLDSSRDLMGVARYAFAPEELADLEILSGEDQRRRFFEYWTLKEAYLKARGSGLSLPMDWLSFELGGGGVSVTFSPELGDDPSHWHFSLLRPTLQHQAAVAIRHLPGRPPDIQVHQA